MKVTIKRHKQLFVALLGTLIASLIIIAALFDWYGWRLFGFRYCSSPENLHISDIKIQDNTCQIKIESANVGSLANASYNGIIYTYQDGVLRIGIHEGVINASTSLSQTIKTDDKITNIMICGNGTENEIDFVKTN